MLKNVLEDEIFSQTCGVRDFFFFFFPFSVCSKKISGVICTILIGYKTRCEKLKLIQNTSLYFFCVMVTKHFP